MQSEMMKTFLGVDIGSSKSHAIIADECGNVLGFGEGGPGNHEVVGYAGLQHTLKVVTEKALQSAGLAREQIAGGGFGISGYDWPSERTPTMSAIQTLRLSAHLELVNDTLLGLIAGAEQGWGIAVVAGSGDGVGAEVASGVAVGWGGGGVLVGMAATAVGVGVVGGGVAVGTGVGVGGNVGVGTGCGGWPLKSRRKTPSPSVAAYRCWPSEDIARALTARVRKPTLMGIHVAPPSVERYTPLKRSAAYITWESVGSNTMSETLASGFRPAADDCHVAPPSGLRYSPAVPSPA